MPIEIDIIKKRTMQRKLNKGANKKALKCYGCGKPGYFARDCRSKNVILRPQINIIKRVPIKKEGTPEDSKPSPVWDNPELNVMLETASAIKKTTD